MQFRISKKTDCRGSVCYNLPLNKGGCLGNDGELINLIALGKKLSGAKTTLLLNY
jgi:hypothetical protein